MGLGSAAAFMAPTGLVFIGLGGLPMLDRIAPHRSRKEPQEPSSGPDVEMTIPSRLKVRSILKRGIQECEDADYQTQILLVEFSLLLFRNKKTRGQNFI
jgi:hypothetical protein